MRCISSTSSFTKKMHPKISLCLLTFNHPTLFLESMGSATAVVLLVGSTKKKDVSIINCLVNSLRNFNIRKRSVCEYQSKLLNSPRVNVSILVNSQMGGPFFESMWDKKDAIEQVTEHITMECFEILRTCQNAWLQGVNEDT